VGSRPAAKGVVAVTRWEYHGWVRLIDDEALILDSSPFRDRHLLLTALSHQHGLMRGVLRRGRGGRKPAGAATQVLSLVHLNAHHSSGAEMITIRQVELLHSSYPLASNLRAAAAAAVVAELLITYCPPFEPAARRYRLGRSCLDALLAGSEPAMVVAYAQLWVLWLSGVLPPLGRCCTCGRQTSDRVTVSAVDGQPHCSDCAPSGGELLGEPEMRFLGSCRATPLIELSAPLPDAVARWLDRLARHEAERPLRALDFFRRHAGIDHG
jgi:DNA repair protein RecO